MQYSRAEIVFSANTNKAVPPKSFRSWQLDLSNGKIYFLLMRKLHYMFCLLAVGACSNEPMDNKDIRETVESLSRKVEDFREEIREIQYRERPKRDGLTYKVDSLMFRLRECEEMTETPGSFMDFVPKAPKYRPMEVVLDYSPNGEGCSLQEEKVDAYVITYPDEFNAGRLLFQHVDGSRFKAFVNGGSNASSSWVPLIFIPGQKVRLELEICGNGGYYHVVAAKTLEREK